MLDQDYLNESLGFTTKQIYKYFLNVFLLVLQPLLLNLTLLDAIDRRTVERHSLVDSGSFRKHL